MPEPASPNPGRRAREARAGFPWPRFWRLAFVLTLLLALAGLGMYVFSPEWLRLERELPVGIQSPLRADYSADLLPLAVQPLGKNVYGDVFSDQPQAAVDPLATLEDRLRTPVLTITPRGDAPRRATLSPTRGQPSAAPSLTPSATGTRTAAPTATQPDRPPTRALPSATPPPARPSASPAPTAVATPAPTHPPAPSATPPPTPAPTDPPAPSATPEGAYPPPETGAAKAK